MSEISSTSITQQRLPRAGQASRRNRPVHACEECRRRKIRCDRKSPCCHCSLSRKTCLFKKPTVRRHSQAVPVSVWRARAHSSDAQATDHPTNGHIENTKTGSLYLDTGERTAATSSNAKVKAILDCNNAEAVADQSLTLDHTSVSRSMESTLSESSDYNVSGTARKLRASLGTKVDLSVLNKSRLFGYSHWSTGNDELSGTKTGFKHENTQAVNNTTLHRLTTEITSLLKQCKASAQSSKACRPSRDLSLQSFHLHIPQQHFATEMSQLYFSTFENVFRILHRPSYLRDLKLSWQHPNNTTTMGRIQINMVVALGCSVSGPSDESVKVMASQFVHDAQSWLGGPFEKDRLTLSGLAIWCLIILARQALSIGGDLINISIGSLVRMAMQLGLHRDPKRFPTLTVMQQETRRRLWATILELDLQASLDAGMVPTIAPDAYDTDMPSDINDEDIVDESTSSGASHDSTRTDVSLQRLMAACLHLRLRQAWAMNGYNTQFSYDDAIRFTRDMNFVLRQIDGWHSVPSSTGAHTYGTTLAHLIIQRHVLCLHRPLLDKAAKDPFYCFSRKTSTDAATFIIERVPSGPLSELMKKGGGIFKNSVIHASLALVTELLIEHRDNGSVLCSSYRTLLLDAVRAAQELSLIRIQAGETNVKLHAKLGAILTQIESVGHDSTLEENVLQTVRESLKTSSLIIQGRSQSETQPNQSEDDDLFSLFPADDLIQDDLSNLDWLTGFGV